MRLPLPREDVFAFFSDAANLHSMRGPYQLWEHPHSFHEVGDETIIEDVVCYGLPFWPLGEIVRPMVRLQLGRIFRFRQSAVRRSLLHRKLPV
jgi:ligand-binding SRPBCC domain-containing protein